jgi:hypothetical protein
VVAGIAVVGGAVVSSGAGTGVDAGAEVHPEASTERTIMSAITGIAIIFMTVCLRCDPICDCRTKKGGTRKTLRILRRFGSLLIYRVLRPVRLRVEQPLNGETGEFYEVIYELSKSKKT